ncbi:MAG: hypothetical protein RLZZ360_156 [Candidatus Parcubacteria bacterium]|jgi:hypothetical protein
MSHDSNSFEVTGLQSLPGKPIRYQIDVVPLTPNMIYHRSFTIRPTEHFVNQRLKIKIYYRGKQYDGDLFISLQSDNL